MRREHYKRLTDDDLAYALDGIEFKTKPRRHQAISLVWACDAGKRLVWWHDIGLGKTLTSLYTNQLWKPRRILVCCPNSVTETWADEIKKHTNLSHHVLGGETEQRRRELAFESDIFIINYGALRWVFGRQVKEDWMLDWGMIAEGNFDSLIFDECHWLRTPTAERTKVARALSQRAKHVLEATATPISTGEENFWSQYDVLDGGHTLGAGHSRFLRKHFEQDYFGKWTIQEGERDEILKRIAPVTLRFSRDECGDLPERIYEQRHCDMTAEQRIKTDGIVGGSVEPIHRGNKLAQIASGFMLDHGKVVWRAKKNPKLDLVMEAVQEVPGKVIIFHAFVEEGRMIEKRLDKLDIGYASMRGETDKKEYKRWLAYDSCRMLVAHPLSAGEGLNLQGGTGTVLFFSNGCYGATIREQAEGRVCRYGQTRGCLIMDFIMRDTIDEERLDKIQSRADVTKAVLAYMEGYSR